MSTVLEQFLTESHDFLQRIGQSLIGLENTPGNASQMEELFRLVHTLKGNCGLFDYPEMSRVLHAAEDAMSAVRDGRLEFSGELADLLLDSMDFVTMLLGEIEETGECGAGHAGSSTLLAEAIHKFVDDYIGSDAPEDAGACSQDRTNGRQTVSEALRSLEDAPEEMRMEWYQRAVSGKPMLWVQYSPEAECFFKGEDPLYQAMQAPGVLWRSIIPSEHWPALAELDAYRCTLIFRFVTDASMEAVEEHFRYVPDQISIVPLQPYMLALPAGDENGGPVYEDFVSEALGHISAGNMDALGRAARTMLELSSASLWLASALRWLLLILEHEPHNQAASRAIVESLRTLESPAWETIAAQAGQTVPDTVQEGEPESLEAPLQGDSMANVIFRAQLEMLNGSDDSAWLPGRLKSAAASLKACYRSLGQAAIAEDIDTSLEKSLSQGSARPLVEWLEDRLETAGQAHPAAETFDALTIKPENQRETAPSEQAKVTDDEPKFGRRAEDLSPAKTLKVEQSKVDRLMNLIGEMVVAKNSLPYLAARAESVFGVRDLSREIKAQYAVINRIAEEMQDAIMQVRMMPVSFIFQRFPRLVRDISRKLGKEVSLVLEGENTEADKNVIESLADPLIHILRNSLDHGIETPDIRIAAGKPARGTLTIRAAQEADRVYIDITDDGKGIDPDIVKRKAYEKGLIDEAALDRISDQEAVNLVFAPGFSTAEAVSDLSGRGVGMDAVRAAVEKVNGTVSLQSERGKGTQIRLSLPLSMAVTNVMIIESSGGIFGVPMDMVVETVRIREDRINRIKNRQVAVLRGQIVPLRSLNDLLDTGKPQLRNDDGELATLVIRANGENIGIVVDDFREVVDIILKPMNGIMAGIPGYSGSALLGDGSVLMVLDPKELL